MTISDEQLMALVDGECSPEERSLLEARIAADPERSRRYAAQQALRDRLRGSFDAVLEEPVPQRLLNAASAARGRRFRPPIWFAAAASLAAGMVLGPFVLQRISTAPQVVFREGQMTADGALAQALSQQLAAEPSSSDPVRVGVSFLSKAGQYCRTFVDHRQRAVAGLACRDADSWRLKVLESGAETPADRATYSQAATSLSPSVLKAVEALMNGDALDAAGEAAARARGWQASGQR